MLNHYQSRENMTTSQLAKEKLSAGLIPGAHIISRHGAVCSNLLALIFFVDSSERSIDSQPAHAAVRKNVETQMRNNAGIQDFLFKQMSHVRLQFRAR
jgi:hypothetical protein